MTYSDDLLRLKEARIKALEAENLKLKNRIEFLEAKIEVELKQEI